MMCCIHSDLQQWAVQEQAPPGAGELDTPTHLSSFLPQRARGASYWTGSGTGR